MDEAAKAKAEGNEKFKAKDYPAAVEAYTRSLEADPNQHLCYSNRCAAYLKVQDKDSDVKALADAEKCVELMPSWGKGYHRVCEALRQLKRSDEAAAVLTKGLSEESLSKEDRDGLERLLKDVPKWKFCHMLSGTWHGTVNEVLGGYDQEMEFLDTESVRVTVLGRTIIGKYWVDTSYDPHHLNIQVPADGMHPGMAPPPPVPYIARIDEVGLHLCCPYLKPERPTEFVGPGYVLMKTGVLADSDNAEIAALSHAEKLLRCCQELLKVMPSKKLEDCKQTDSEDAAGEKLMVQVRFESSMFSVVKMFGEDVVKEVLAATRGQVPKELEGVEEVSQLAEKLRICGIIEEEGAPSPAKEAGHASMMEKPGGKSASNSTPAAERTAAAAPGSSPEARKPGEGRGNEQREDTESDSFCSAAVGGVVLSAAALAAVAFMLSRKH